MNGRTLRWLMSFAHVPRGAGPRARLTIVRHHRVYADGETPLYRLGVAERVLDQQLGLLARQGLAPLSVSAGLAWLASGEPGRRVAMSFDDGYADNVTRALPLLQRHGGRATFYLTAGLMEERRAPWWDELAHALERAQRPAARFAHDGLSVDLEVADVAGRARALASLLPLLRVAPAAQRARLDALRATLGVLEPAPCALASWSEAARLAEAGMEIGAHTLSHPFLSRCEPDVQRDEIGGSIERIERRLGLEARGLAYPGGDYDAETLEICASLGLAHAVTTAAGDVTRDAPPYELRRRGLSEGACLGPDGRFSRRLARAELDGAFDRLRRVEVAS